MKYFLISACSPILLALYLKLSKAYPNASELIKKIDAFLVSQDTINPP
jgi:hypothetical protein